MKINMYELITSILLVMSSFYSNTTKAQNNAESLFDPYYKWGLTGQYNIFSAADISPTYNTNLRYEIVKSELFALGFIYNIHQHKNWNLKTALQLQWFGDRTFFTITGDDNPTPFNIGSFINTSHDKIGYLPVTAEYIFKNKEKLAFAIGGGVGITYLEPYENERFRLSVDGIPRFRFNYKSDDSPFYMSSHLEINMYLKRKKFLLQTSIVYKKSFTSFRTGSYEFVNLEVSPDVQGTIDQSGDFIGVAISFYLKKKEKK